MDEVVLRGRASDCAQEMDRDPFAGRFGPPPLRLMPRETPPEPPPALQASRLARIERGLWFALCVVMLVICAVAAMGEQP